jgi:hypothetical protein
VCLPDARPMRRKVHGLERVRLRSSGALSAMELVVASLDEKTVQLFSPLFGGARVTAKTASLTRAA